MKKLFVLSSIALASASQAYTLVDNQETGTKLDFNGSVRLAWRSSSTTDEVNGNVKKNHINHAVANNGSRFGFKLTQQISNGFYGLGRVEWRFRGTAPSQHNFDDIYIRQLYAGIGHKQYGELTYGHQTVITDSVKQTDLGNALSLSDGLLEGAARKSLQYVYNGIDGLKVGAFYAGSSKRDNNGLELSHPRKDVWGIGAVYTHKLDELQKLTVGAGVSRERRENQDNSTTRRTAYSLGTAYTFNKTTFGIDLERRDQHDYLALGKKVVNKEVRTVISQKLTDDWRAYAMYAHKIEETKGQSKTTLNQYMVGTEYFIVPTYVKGFVEWQTSHLKNSATSAKKRHNTTAIGVRAYW